MSDPGTNHISKKQVLYDLPGRDAVIVRRDVEFPGADGAPLLMDLYVPPGVAAARVPAVVIAAGYRDAGFEAMVGCRFKEMGSSVSWARLIAASGLAAITYTNREPAGDLAAAVAFVRGNAPALGVDHQRVGLWASSGNVPVALSLLMHDSAEPIASAALGYGYLLDLDGSTGVADAAATFKFANPCRGRTIADLRAGSPLFLARAGQDQMPGLNASIDRFVARALAANLPLTLVNHPNGPHAFDLFDDSPATRAIVGQILAFLRAHLLAETENGVGAPR